MEQEKNKVPSQENENPGLEKFQRAQELYERYFISNEEACISCVILLIITSLTLEMSCKQADAGFLYLFYRFFQIVCIEKWHAVNGAHRRAYYLTIINICRGTVHNDTCNSGSFSGP